MAFFPSPLWSNRLQLLWVSFTVLFIAIGEYYTSRWISSVLVTIGALLILLIITQILHVKDISKTRPTLLLAFISILFLGKEALNVYSDKLALLFCLLVALCLAILVWSNDDKFTYYLKTLLFTILIFLVLLSFSQLISTLSIKYLISEHNIPKEIYIISPHALGMTIGIMLGASFSNSLIKTNNDDINITKLLLCFALFYILAIWASYSFNNLRIEMLTTNNKIGLLYTAIYTFFQLSITITSMAYYVIKRKNTLSFLSQWTEFLLLIPLVIATISTTVNSVFYTIGNELVYPIILSFAIEWFSSFLLVATILLSSKLVSMISNWAHYQEIMYNKALNADAKNNRAG